MQGKLCGRDVLIRLPKETVLVKEAKNQIFKKNIAVFVLMIIFFVTVITFYYNVLGKVTKDNILKECELNAVRSSNEIDKYLIKGMDSINTTEGFINSMIRDGRSSAEILDFLVGQSKAVESILPEATTGLYGYINGEYLDGDGWVPGDDYDPLMRPWYIQARENKGMIVVVDPYLDAQTGQMIITLAKELCDAKSVVAIDLSLKELQNITEIITGKNETIMVLGHDYHVIAHSDRNEINKDYRISDGSFGSSVVSAYIGTEGNSFRVNYGNTEYIVYSRKLDNNWTALCATDTTDAYRSLRTPFIITVIVSVIIAGLMILNLVLSEKRRRRTQQLEEETRSAVAANNAKTAFLANMSHEIRTPINAILGMNEMVLRESGDGRILKYSENIKTAGDKLLDIVNDMLDFSKTRPENVSGIRKRFTAPLADILVVDDNPMNIEVFKSLVRRTLIPTDTGSSGEDAISRTGSKKYDLIFLDHMMPEKDGIETLAQIRGDKQNPNVATPVVCLTANAISGAKEFYLDAGFDDYLTKPIDPDRLETILLKYIPNEKISFYEDKAKEDTTKDIHIPEELGELTELPVDVAAGIANSGSVDDYIMLIKVFRESLDDRKRELDRLFNDRDYRNYIIKVHALKSSLLLIGAKHQAEYAQKLEDAGKQGDYDYIMSNHEQFMSEYGRLAGPLEKALGGADDTDEGKTMVSEDKLAASYEALRAAADDMDCDRLEDIMNELRRYRIPVEHKERINRLYTAVRNYEYESVISIIDGIEDKD